MVPCKSADHFNDKFEMTPRLDIRYYNWFPLGFIEMGLLCCMYKFISRDLEGSLCNSAIILAFYSILGSHFYNPVGNVLENFVFDKKNGAGIKKKKYYQLLC